MSFKTMGIDRGALRRNIAIYQFAFSAATLFALWGVFSIITPWFYYVQIKLAVNKTKKDLAEGKI